MKFKLSVVIGRLEPMHKQHEVLVNEGLAQADHVLVLFGGAERPPTIKNPLSAATRIDLLTDWATRNGVSDRMGSVGIRDYMYSDSSWVSEVQWRVNSTFENLYGRKPKKGEVCLVGCEKDSSSYYLKMFPQWTLISMPLGDTLDSTQIRKLLFEGKSLSYISGAVPEETLHYLEQFRTTDLFKQLVREYEFIEKYKEAWKAAPYDPVFVTTDAWVVQSGHVLLITRGQEPGYGLKAAAGGFLQKGKTLLQSMICELREETKLKVPEAVLIGSIIDQHVFDSPNRSMRGRTITHSYLIKLKDDHELAHIAGNKKSDDAMCSQWTEFTDVRSDNMYEDHYDQWMFFKSKI